MKFLAARKAEQNLAAVDPWTAVHVAAGLAAGLMEIPLRWAFAASVAYEIVEQVAERRAWGQRLFEVHAPESGPNVVVDLIALVAGHRLGQLWNRT
jgi:hypothetical protein